MALARVAAILGLPGAGKTALAQALAQQLHWPVVDRDAFPRARFTDAEKAAAIDAAFAQVAMLLSRGQSCIVDGMTFADAGQRERLRALAHQAGATAVLFWLDCPVEVAIARVQAQKDHPAADRDADLVRDVARRFALPDEDVVRLDGRRPTQDLLQEVVKRL